METKNQLETAPLSFDELSLYGKVYAVLASLQKPVSGSLILRFAGIDDIDSLDEETKTKIVKIFMNKDVVKSENDEYVITDSSRQVLASKVDMRSVEFVVFFNSLKVLREK